VEPGAGGSSSHERTVATQHDVGRPIVMRGEARPPLALQESPLSERVAEKHDGGSQGQKAAREELFVCEEPLGSAVGGKAETAVGRRRSLSDVLTRASARAHDAEELCEQVFHGLALRVKHWVEGGRLTSCLTCCLAVFAHHAPRCLELDVLQLVQPRHSVSWLHVRRDGRAAAEMVKNFRRFGSPVHGDGGRAE
jgi:hypothetical protein